MPDNLYHKDAATGISPIETILSEAGANLPELWLGVSYLKITGKPLRLHNGTIIAPNGEIIKPDPELAEPYIPRIMQPPRGGPYSHNF
ncbi:MAG: hypothetical protein HGA85_07510 [Nanoarchaeota archaeon]|nr:hypothetical protein [Nanoarchaeota archaeon]